MFLRNVFQKKGGLDVQNINYPLRYLHLISSLPPSPIYLTDDGILLMLDDQYVYLRSADFTKTWSWDSVYNFVKLFFYGENIFAYDIESKQTKVFDLVNGNSKSERFSSFLPKEIIQDFVIGRNKVNNKKCIQKLHVNDFLKGDLDNSIWQIFLKKMPKSLLLKGDQFIINQDSKELVCHDWKSGKKLWQVAGNKYYEGLFSTIFSGNQVIWNNIIIACFADKILGLDIFSGQQIWFRQLPVQGITGVSLDETGRLYTITYENYLIFDASNGKLLFKKPISEMLKNYGERPVDFSFSNPLLTNKHLIFTDKKHNLIFADKQTGNIEWDYRFDEILTEAPPKVVGNRLYLKDVNSNLIIMEE